MGLELRQQLKLTQQLVMTPQLQQAIKLLQLSRLELMETVQQELLENPFLEEGPVVAEVSGSDDAGDVQTSKAEDVSPATAADESVTALRDADWEDYLGEFSSTAKQSMSRNAEVPEEGMSFEARLSSKPSLEGHIAWQMRLSDLTEHEVLIGEHIIGNLDRLGYLQADVEEIASETDSDVEDVERVLHRVQRLDPVGIAARTPRECLLIQLEVEEYQDPVLLSLVGDHLEDLEKRRYKPLLRKFKMTMEELHDYLETIQTLDPMPGASFGSEDPIYVSPDAYVYKYEDDFVIVLNDDGLPKLQINDSYSDSLKSGGAGADKDFFQEKMRSAVWLMKSLYQRQRTLYKVIESLLKFQRDFFEEGVTRLKPLILKDVADDISMHESTVSRITTSKYVATPHGTFELKFFFNSALDLDDGSQVGSESVKALIKKIVDDENPKKPFSDEKIAEMLKEKLQVNIARRTVAKYRTALGIASSSKRKQYF
ncbi:MAG: RNA polymerase factor sigma-54 [Desulfovibrio sp.]|uniref:RNA polymerase factor sigma-54 n=1 Tax=Desulfovibrio sp. 7SRBS1 TaxID=3378064 RepID=UPI003B3EA6B8